MGVPPADEAPEEPGAADARTLLVPPARWVRWVENVGVRHGHVSLAVGSGTLSGAAEDGARFTASLPFDAPYDGPPDAGCFAAAAGPPAEWGVLLVRKGGFAVASLRGDRIAASKVGRRHVQGRSKAGGQSQQRFARRRENQAREAFQAAADHAARVLGTPRGPSALPVVTGGDHGAVAAVLADPRLAGVEVLEPWLTAPTPRREALDAAVRDASSIRVRLRDG